MPIKITPKGHHLEVKEMPPKPDLLLQFDEHDYEKALENYHIAREWVLFSGQCFRQDMAGIIKSPAHPKSSAEEKIVPNELIDDPHWTVTVELYCTTKEVFEWLKGLEIPENSKWVELNKL